jgi:hypothetical protein
MRAMLVHRPEHAYPRIDVPTLVIRGELDVVVPQEWFEEVVAAIPDASSFVVEGHHHETLIRDAEPAGTEIRRWLRAARRGERTRPRGGLSRELRHEPSDLALIERHPDVGEAMAERLLDGRGILALHVGVHLGDESVETLLLGCRVLIQHRLVLRVFGHRVPLARDSVTPVSPIAHSSRRA